MLFINSSLKAHEPCSTFQLMGYYTYVWFSETYKFSLFIIIDFDGNLYNIQQLQSFVWTSSKDKWINLRQPSKIRGALTLSVSLPSSPPPQTLKKKGKKREKRCLPQMWLDSTLLGAYSVHRQSVLVSERNKNSSCCIQLENACSSLNYREQNNWLKVSLDLFGLVPQTS